MSGSLINKINQVMLVILALTLPYNFSHGILLAFLVLFSVQVLINLKPGQVSVRNFTWPLVSFVMFVLIEVTSLFWSQDQILGFAHFEKRIPFLFIILLTLLMGRARPRWFNKAVKYYSTGVVLFLLISTLNLFYQFFFGHLRGAILYNGIQYIDLFLEFGLRTYLGTIVLMAIPIWYEQIFLNRKVKIKCMYSALILLACIILYLSGGRGILMALGFLSAFLLVDFLGKTLTRWQAYLIVTLAIAVIATVIYQSPRFTGLRNIIESGDMLASGEMRIGIWENSLDIAGNKFFFGHGVGDVKEALIAGYEQRNMMFEFEHEFNAHNQYLQSFVGSGIFAPMFILLFLLLLFFKRGEKSVYRRSFVIVYGINFLFESMWVRNMGVVSASFWLLVFFNFDPGEQTQSIKGFVYKFKTSALIIIGLILLFIVYSGSKAKFNSEDPSSYMQVSYTTEEALIPNGEITKSVQIDIDKLKSVRIPEGEFLNIPFYRSFENNTVLVDGSIWVKVPDENPAGKVWFYIYSKFEDSHVSIYDLSSKNEWQKLEVNSKMMTKSFEIGLRIDYFDTSKEQWEDNKGTLIIANPNYNIKPVTE